MTNQDTVASLHFKRAGEEQSFVDKAFEELEGLSRFLMSTTPQPVIDICKIVHQAIDTYIDRPADEKEALKALTVFQFGMPYLYDDTRRFKDRYNQALSDMVDDQLQGNRTINQAQLELALMAASHENCLATLSNPEDRQNHFPKHQVPELINNLHEELATIDGLALEASAPRLIERVKALNAECLRAATEDPSAKAAPAPSAP